MAASNLSRKRTDMNVMPWATVLFMITGLFLASPPVQSAEAAASSLCVMTYNLRYASPRPPNAWPDRRPIMVECIKSVGPDLIGTQEGLYSQLKDLAADLKDYEWIGLGREGGSKGEFMAIFYKPSRFDPVEYDHFWLSDTPNVIASATWGNAVRRMVTWVRFRDKQTEREFYLVNTHFDHQVQASREKSAELLRQRIAELKTDLPIIVTGDFNADAKNKTYEILTRDGFLSDTWGAAKTRKGEGLNSFNSFKEIGKNNSRIDWILTKGKVSVDSTELVTFAKDGQFPSDHFPIVAWLRLGN